MKATGTWVLLEYNGKELSKTSLHIPDASKADWEKEQMSDVKPPFKILSVGGLVRDTESIKEGRILWVDPRIPLIMSVMKGENYILIQESQVITTAEE